MNVNNVLNEKLTCYAHNQVMSKLLNVVQIEH